MDKNLNMITEVSAYEVNRYYFSELNKQMQKKDHVPESIFSVTDHQIGKKIKTIVKEPGTLFMIDTPLGEQRNFNGEGIYEEADNQAQLITYLTNYPSTQIDNILHLGKGTVVLTKTCNAASYLETYYGIHAKMQPMFGIEGKKRIPFGDRKYDVFFPGTYLDPATCLTQMKDYYPTTMYEIAMDMIHYMMKDTEVTVEEALCQKLKKMNVNCTKELITSYLKEYSTLILEYCCREQRKQMLLKLIQGGLKITVCGQHWDVFQELLVKDQQQRLEVLYDAVPPQKVIELMGNAKIVLNYSPYYNGVNERVATAMLNGAVCFTDSNAYLKEHMKNHQEIELYIGKNVTKLVNRIRTILMDNSMGIQISENAGNYARENLS
ncbi:MAG: hypothetical protein RSE55_09835, partial [Lachnospiraceae bacterium]